MCSLYKSASTDVQRREVFVAALQDNWSTFYSEYTSQPCAQLVLLCCIWSCCKPLLSLAH